MLQCERNQSHHTPWRPSATTYVAGRTCGDFRALSLVRTHAQSCLDLQSSRARDPYMDGCEFSPATVLRTVAQPKYSKRFRPAYGTDRARAASHVQDETPGTTHRPASRPRIAHCRRVRPKDDYSHAACAVITAARYFASVARPRKMRQNDARGVMCV